MGNGINLPPYAVHMQSLKFRPFVDPENHVYKKIELLIFFGKIQEIKKKLDGHRPSTTCYLCAKYWNSCLLKILRNVLTKLSQPGTQTPN